MQDASTGLTEPFTQPLAICKRWLLNLFPLLRNEELVSRVAWTLMIIAIARLGLYLKLPYVDSRFAPRNAIVSAMDAMFGGSVQMPDHVFLLGVGPAINASICASVAMTNFLGAGPRDWKAHIESLKDSGAEGSATIAWYINLAGAFFAVILGTSEAIRLAPHARHTAGVPFVLLTVIILAAGATVLRYLADSVETRGLGDGISLLIALSIVSNYAVVLNKATVIVSMGKIQPLTIAMLVAAYLGLVILTVFINGLSLRLRLVFYKQRRSKAPQASVQKRKAVSEAVGSTEVVPDNAYLPILLNPNGMSALLYASFIYQLPTLVGIFSYRGQQWMHGFLSHGKWYPFVYGLVVFASGAVQFGQSTPGQMSKYLNAIEAGIEDVSPGPATERFLKRKMRVVRVWGAFLVAVLATAAQGFDRMCSETLGTSLGSVSLLLVVGLITSSIRQVQSLLQLPQLEKALQRERSVLQRMSFIHSTAT